MLALVTRIIATAEGAGEHVGPELPFSVKGHGECSPFTTWCQFRGIGAVAIAVGLFVGLPMLILSTNIGVRKASAVTVAAMFAYLTIHGFLWIFYPRGPIIQEGRRIMGLPPAISTRVPAILLMAGAGIIFAVLCVLLSRIDKPRGEEPTLG